MFSGTFTALVTPFRDDRFDEEAFTQLVEAQIAGGVEGIVPVGTTGESPTLDHGEHLRVIELAAQVAAKRVKVIAGTGSNSTAEAIDLTVAAEKSGADAALLVAPYYNKPSQQGLFLHFSKIAEATKLPLILYSIPSRCGIEIAIETVRRLADACPTIVAIKEAGGSVERVSGLRVALPDEFDILSGDDSLTLPFMSVGACGVISVASNLLPKTVSDFVRAALAGKGDEARRWHQQLHPLFKGIFVEPNPVPIKHALALRGVMQPDVRLPLCAMSPPNAADFEVLLRDFDELS
ncbi:MAG: 4-hydroxy-tetrahydrodipicolinate synthase [Chthoniobacteraceae bacterium]